MKQTYFELIWLRGVGALKADAQNSYLGTLWWILEPLLLSGLFYLAFASGLRGGGNEGFVFFLLSGMLPFKWTASSLTGCGNSLISNQGILGQVYLPKWIFPATVNLSMGLRYCIVLPLLLVIMSLGGYTPELSWFSLGYLVLCQLLFNLGISYLAAAWVPLIPDLSHVIPIVVTALLFTSGVFFDIADRPEEMQAILRLNPFVEILEGYRTVLLDGQWLSVSQLMYPCLAGIVLFVVGFITLKVFDRYYPRALP